MTIPTIKIHNVETGKVIERDMTAKEIAEIETIQLVEAANIIAEAEAKAAEEAAKQQAFNDAVAAAVAAALAAQQQ